MAISIQGLFVAMDLPKLQITNYKKITMTQIPNSKPVWDIEYWYLVINWNLVLGI
jgi:hypothetical protein